MSQHTPPLLIILAGPALSVCVAICRETVVRTAAYIGADLVFARFIAKHEKQVRSAIDTFLDD